MPLDEVKAGNNIQQALSKLIVPPKQKSPVKPVPVPTERKLAVVR